MTISSIGDSVCIGLLYVSTGAVVAAGSGLAPPVAGAILMGSYHVIQVSMETVVDQVTQNRVLSFALGLISMVGAAWAGLRIAGLSGYAIAPLSAAKIFGISFILVNGLTWTASFVVVALGAVALFVFGMKTSEQGDGTV